MSASLFAQATRELFHHHSAWPAQFFEDRLAITYSKILEPGDNAIDVGAHTGFHAKQILDRIGEAGKLTCVEPLPEIFKILTANLKDRPGNIVLFNGVLSDTLGEVTFTRAIGLPGESGLRQRRQYAIPDTKIEEITVESRSIDEFLSPDEPLKYIKIDTEGAELTILNSSKTVMQQLRPVISVEWGSDTYLPYNHKAEDLYRLARSRQYSIFDLFVNMVGSEREWLEVSDRGSWDFLLVPDEKIAWYVYSQNA